MHVPDAESYVTSTETLEKLALLSIRRQPCAPKVLVGNNNLDNGLNTPILTNVAFVIIGSLGPEHGQYGVPGTSKGRISIVTCWAVRRRHSWREWRGLL